MVSNKLIHEGLQVMEHTLSSCPPRGSFNIFYFPKSDDHRTSRRWELQQVFLHDVQPEKVLLSSDGAFRDESGIAQVQTQPEERSWRRAGKWPKRGLMEKRGGSQRFISNWDFEGFRLLLYPYTQR